MYRKITTSNKLVTKRWRDRTMEIHREKLRTVKPSAACVGSPPTYPHLISKPKTN